MAQPSVMIVRFYTRSTDPHNRQIVVIMRGSRNLRFTEGKMRKELSYFALEEPIIREIEAAAIEKATTFGVHQYMADNEEPADGEEPLPVAEDSLENRDWHTVQNLLAEFQSEVDRLYR